MSTLATRLKKARERLKMSQADVARLAGVTQSAIGNLEAGSRLTSRNLVGIARALRVHANWLESGIGPMAADAQPEPEWPFRLLTREQWSDLSERERGAVEVAARRAAHGLLDQDGLTAGARTLAAAFDALPEDERARMYPILHAALRTPERARALLDALQRAETPNGAPPAAQKRPRT